MINPRKVSAGPGQSFFGYYDKSPWDADGSRLAYINSNVVGRHPVPEDIAKVMVVIPESDILPSVCAETRAWNWQQGCMLRWRIDGSALIFNDRYGGTLVARVVELSGKELHVTPFPIYDCSSDGDTTVSVNFARLAWTRPGYGYAGIEDPFRHSRRPEADGLRIGSIRDSKEEVILSTRKISERDAPRFFRERVHWLNHATFSPSGRRIAFLHRSRSAMAAAGGVMTFGTTPRSRSWKRVVRRQLGALYRRVTGGGFASLFSRLFVVNLDGTNLQCVVDSGVCSHFGWRDDNSLVFWGSWGGSMPAYWLVDLLSGKVEPAGAGLPGEDGHCSYSRDGRWLLTDTYQSAEKPGLIVLKDTRSGQISEIGRFRAAPGFSGELRCDFHPRLRSDNRMICFDSTHEGARNVYVADVSSIVTRSTQ